MLTEMKIDFGTAEFSIIRFGFYTFNSIFEQVLEFMFMNFMILMTIYAGWKLELDFKQYEGMSDEEIEKIKTENRLEKLKGWGGLVTTLLSIFYLNIELVLMIILMFQIGSKVKLYNFFLNLYLMFALLYP